LEERRSGVPADREVPVTRTSAALIGVFGVLLLTAVAPTAATQAGERSAGERHGLQFRGLKPGEFVVHRQRVPVDIVLIGFKSEQVNQADLLGVLPETYKPVVRYPRFYGLQGRDTGLEFLFTYSLTRMSRATEKRFFEYLLEIGQEIPRTLYQTQYNNQTRNVLDVTDAVLDIDAASVERWLETYARPRRAGYTVYFVNWHGRSDFRFHVYTKKDDPDPDTGHVFGARQSRAITSWGGTTSRTWFYDFSAGPEWNTSNWVVDVKDLNGDGREEYRMPPIWEYADHGYRSAADLGFDMGLLTRFVAINLLFTTSPLYDPLNAAPETLGRRVVDTTILEDDPASRGIDWFDREFAHARWKEFQPYYSWKSAARSLPIDAGAKKSLEIFVGNFEDKEEKECWVPFGTPFAQLFCYFTANLGLYVPGYRDRDYVAPIFGFNTTDDGIGDQFGLLGFADDNWVDGTQTLTFAFETPTYRDVFGYGFTGTIIHEVGHHIGLSHPHDGYDSEFNIDYGPGGSLFFAWEGDESDTVMHYLGLTNRFGDHNRDNMYRWETAGYLNWANALAGDILASDRAPFAALLIIAADTLAAKARSHFNAWEYGRAVQEARAAYALLAEAADLIGVSSDALAQARMALPPSRIEKYVCRPRDLMERLGD
jgi:hypothetical protein